MQSSAFVTRLSSDGSTILFSTFLRGHPSLDPVQSSSGGYVYSNVAVSPVQTYGQGIAIDTAGNIAVTGATRSQDFPTTPNALDPANANFLDAWVAVLSGDGSSLLYSTYLGGGYSDGARGVAFDLQGNLIVGGQTYSDDFPVANAAQPVKAKYDDAFLTKIVWR